MSAAVERPVVAVSMGDPAGVGPELALRILNDPQVDACCVPVIFGDAEVLQRVAREQRQPFAVRVVPWSQWRKRPAVPQAPTVIDLRAISAQELEPGRVDRRTGHAAYAYVDAAIWATLNGHAHALATGPIHKEAMNQAGIPYPGHTELLAARTAVESAYMMFVSPQLCVSLVTGHVGYRDVPQALSVPRIVEAIGLTAQVMRVLRGREPLLGVCGLNPHAGEHGLFGYREEEELILPAIETARAMGLRLQGPLPPDTAFIPRRRRELDAIVCMYHDQGLIALKALAFEDAVHLTLGLPIIRTSVDHGTALDIAWQGKAQGESLRQAVLLAAQLAAQHQQEPVRVST